MAAPRPAVTMTRGAVILLLLISLAHPACRSRSEAEALQEAREEVRREMQPEIDRRRREIEALQREIAATKARIEAAQAKRQEKP
jgi:outer membrane protein TolC